MKDKDRKLEYANRLMLKLLRNKDLFFDGDYINSDGRRVFEEIARIVLEKYPWLKNRIRKIRKDPCIHRLVDLYNELFE